jgi:hypothetical protein
MRFKPQDVVVLEQFLGLKIGKKVPFLSLEK